jgi:phosphate acetyltransferase
MDIINKIRNKAKSSIKTVVLPEFDDGRVLEAAKIIEREKIAKVIVLAPDKINAGEKKKYAQDFYELRKAKGLTLKEAQEALENPLYYAAMMTREGKVDGFVAGASHTTPDVVRASLQCLGVDERFELACSCFIMAVPDCEYGENGTFIFSDCGVIPEPNSRQLACIAITAADLVKKVLDIEPRVALLSYSTRGSAKGKYVEEVKEALGIVKQMQPGLLIDGELQVDAAIVPEVAQIKYPNSVLKGKANVLIFPNLEAGNIGYKLVQRLAKARAVGPLLLGLNKPCSDLSRGCSVEDIVDCVAVTAIRAQ